MNFTVSHDFKLRHKLSPTLFILLLLLTIPVKKSFGQNLHSIKKTGDYLQIALPLTALGTTYLLNDKAEKKHYYQSFAATILLTYLGKIAVPTMRPDGSNRYSFISGHTSAATFGAAFLARQHGRKIGIPAFLAAGFVGWSRIKSKKHHVGDVLRGAALGLLMPYWDSIKLYKITKIRPTKIENSMGLYLELIW